MALEESHAATIQRVEAAFGFTSFDCDPDEITNAMGISPDEMRRAGEKLPLRRGRSFEAPFSSWQVNSRVVSKDVNDHLRELLARLQGTASHIDPAWGLPSFNVIYRSTHLWSGGGPFFEADVLQGIAALGAELWQDIYAVEEAGTGSR